jgi:hypothetical protein
MADLYRGIKSASGNQKAVREGVVCVCGASLPPGRWFCGEACFSAVVWGIAEALMAFRATRNVPEVRIYR